MFFNPDDQTLSGSRVIDQQQPPISRTPDAVSTGEWVVMRTSPYQWSNWQPRVDKGEGSIAVSGRRSHSSLTPGPLWDLKRVLTTLVPFLLLPASSRTLLCKDDISKLSCKDPRPFCEGYTGVLFFLWSDVSMTRLTLTTIRRRLLGWSCNNHFCVFAVWGLNSHHHLFEAPTLWRLW